MKFYLIVNPVSGNFRGSKIAKQFIQLLENHQLLATVFYTNQTASFKHLLPHILKKIALDKFNNYRCIIIGGDGTLNEILNTLIKTNKLINLAYFPAGTGNDFNREIQQTTNIKHWLQQQLMLEQSTQLEYLWITDHRNGFQHASLNSLGIGIDAQICHVAQTSLFKKILNYLNLGKFSYLALLFKILPNRQNFNATLTIGQQQYKLNNLLLLTVANHKYYGGGIKIAPCAQQNNHKMNIIALKNDKINRLAHAAQAIFKKNKNHLDHDLFLSFEAHQISLTLPQSCVYLQIDGEAILLNYPQLSITLHHYPLWI